MVRELALLYILCCYFGVDSNRVFTEGTCKLLNLVISDLVDEDVVLHSRRQAISALIFGTVALLSKPGQTLAPLIGTWMLSVRTGEFEVYLHLSVAVLTPVHCGICQSGQKMEMENEVCCASNRVHIGFFVIYNSNLLTQFL